MKANIRLPEHFSPYGSGSIYSNFEKEINWKLADFIKNKPLSVALTAWDYFGVVWWNDELEYWCIEIWKYRQYYATHMAESLEKAIKEIQDAYGYK